MNLLDEYKQLYTSEMSHSDRLNNKIGFYITFLTIQGTGNIVIWTKYFSHQINTIYLLLCFISFVSFISSIFLFYKAFSGYEYAYFPVGEMKNKVEQTISITKNIDKGKNIADQHIEYMFRYTYIKCATISLLLIGITYAYSMIFIDNIHIIK